uniref:lysozyme n=1 Tax=Hirudinaria manillensis TaxID=1348078 RepID=A0A977KR00_HIRMN|nr:destabilase [Hirudinaria manillensis]
MNYAVFVTLLVVYAIDVAKCSVPSDCLRCICQIEGCDSEIGRCIMDSGSLSCGPYQIKEVYWIDCGRPGGDYQTCTKEKSCSERCIHAYMNKYANRCTGGRHPTCQDYAKIHNMGPNGCQSSNNHYWDNVRRCLG